MFESAELGHKIDKETFRAEEPKLRAALLEAQDQLRENGSFPVIILISGVDGSGKGETINTLYEWMDPRYMSTHAFYAPTAEERSRPSMWRYWRALPPKGYASGFFRRFLVFAADRRTDQPTTSRGPISTSAWTSSTASRRCW
jgi:polyphosphate kinase 2 (PPK2 family)